MALVPLYVYTQDVTQRLWYFIPGGKLTHRVAIVGQLLGNEAID